MSMDPHTSPISLTAVSLALGLSLGLGPASALADEHPNMKVLEHPGSSLKKHMKRFSKGLGVKCTACHVKKDWDAEDKALKDKSRAFFRAVVGEKDEAKRKEALAELLKLLELDAPRDEALLWKGVDALKKKS